MERRRYSQEFKRGAVEQTRISGVTLQQVADELGVNPRLLSRCRQQYLKEGSKAFPGQGKSRDEEMAALKCENARLRKERDSLKEAAALFAKTSK